MRTLLLGLFAATALTACLKDADGDGFKDDVDCDDTSTDVSPDATETCNGIDDDCNGLIDDQEDGLVDGQQPVFADADADGFGDSSASLMRCGLPDGYVADNTDCDDTTSAANPGATEVCDGIDNDCDTFVDDADPDLDPATLERWFADADADGFGDPDRLTLACESPAEHVVDDTDCDDADDAINPGAVDIPQDGIDQDCDGADAPYSVSDLSAGDLVITEFMQDPEAVDDTLGEWFEVYNRSGGQVDLNGLYVQDDGSDSFTVSDSLVVDADEYVVFGANGDTTVNGGVTVDYAYGSSMELGNGDDQITLADSSSLTTLFDEIAYDDSYPDGAGASTSLDDGLDATDNDEGSSWCLATSAYGDGDLGTPGAANPTCRGPTYTVGNDSELGSRSIHSANFLLGSRLVLDEPGTLDKFGLISLSSGPQVKMALYADVDGSPGTLVAQTSSATLTGARQELDITDVSLAAGTYYIMAIYDRTANVSYSTSTRETVYYRSLSFSSGLPSTFGSAMTYPGQEFSYYVVMY